MSLYHVKITPEQARALGEWAHVAYGSTDVLLYLDDRMLIASQGDDRAAWDTGGQPASDEYLAVAPVDIDPMAAES